MNFLTDLLRRVFAMLAMAIGVLLAAVFALLGIAAAVSIGITLWIAARLGMRAAQREMAREARDRTEVIDVTMREIDDDPDDRPR